MLELLPIVGHLGLHHLLDDDHMADRIVARPWFGALPPLVAATLAAPPTDGFSLVVAELVQILSGSCGFDNVVPGRLSRRRRSVSRTG